MPSSDPPPAPDPGRPGKSPRLGELVQRIRGLDKATLLEALRGIRARNPRRWILPLGCLLLAATFGFILLGKIKKEVWAYYTDDEGIRTEVEEKRVRYVLWQDPQPHVFEEPGEDAAPAAKMNEATGRIEAAYSPDGTQMILVHWQERNSNADLYLSRWDGRVWSLPEALTSLNTPRNERGPAYSRDGRLLYFSSDREGGAGGYDLYAARWSGSTWEQAHALKALNSPADEEGPAVSSDDSRLFFSSNRDGAREDDIFVAQRTDQASTEEDNPPVQPTFQAAEPVPHLNSDDHDVQAALTARGNHVFLASDRDATAARGYGVYFSRVVEGVSLEPEQIDLYIDRGDLTDPTVRMDGFDLLFGSNHEDGDAENPGFRLYRSTTREVIGYTDLSRWEQFKDLLGNIAWWLLLGLLAIIALIYLLESWRDITSLFHKCLAGSAAVHLIILVIFAALLIAKELEVQSDPPTEIALSVDAFTEEELALESVPEETEITQPDLSLPAEKAAAAFDVPELQPQDDAQALPIDSDFQSESIEIEVKTAQATPTEEPLSAPSEPSALLSELSETVLPEPDQPVLDERELANAPEAAPSEDNTFTPNEVLPSSERSESEAVADRAVETPAEAAEVEPSQSLTDQPAPATLTEVSPAQADQSETDQVEAPASLDSELLAELPENSPLASEPLQLEEGDPNAAAQPANPDDGEFSPENPLVVNAGNPAQAEGSSDAPASDTAEASEVGSGALEASPIAAGPGTPVGEAGAESALPEPATGQGPGQELPETAFLDPGAPQLDEGNPASNDEPADSSDDTFAPSNALAENTTTPMQPSPVADNALAGSAEAAEVTEGELASTPVTIGPSPAVGEAQSPEASPDTPSTSTLPNDLPATALLDPGTPTLEEGNPNPEAAPANPANDAFTPGGANTAQTSSPTPNGSAAGTAVATVAEATEVADGELAQAEAPDPAGSVGEAQGEEGIPDAALVANLSNNPSELELLPADLPQLDEGAGDAPGSPAGGDAFEPGDPSSIASKQQGEATGDSAQNEPAPSSEISQGQLTATQPATGSAPTVGEAQSDANLPSPGGTPLAENLPDSSLLDPGAPTLEEGPQQQAAGRAGEESFNPESGAIASRAVGRTTGDQASPSELSSDAVAGGGLVREAADLTGMVSGLESDRSTPASPAGSLGPASLEPSQGLALLPGALEAPELKPGAMTDFIKKQRGRPSLEIIKQLGGSDGTEAAIRASIRWLAENQEDDGRWDSKKHGAKGRFDTGNTGLALLCFYGWGARHDRDGEYREHVQKAIDYLLNEQKSDGDLSGGGLMYCHAIASIVLCEAYGITRDEKLREPAERAIAYTLSAQSKSRGGWRYNPGEDSDTSITGWQYMALHSARLAGLNVPEEHFERARAWFDRAGGGRHGGLYGYQGPGTKWPAMIATGMFCRQLDLVPPTSPMQIESASALKRTPMRSSNPDLYYIYYATLALYQHQGPIWEAWNEKLKETLPRIQNKTGSKSGSWDLSRGLTANGGRIASTALATLSLEVYYRILPMYGFRGEEEDAPEVKVRKSENED